MGIFAKLRSVFFAKAEISAASSANAGQPSMITAYDESGRQVMIPREEWQKRVLPGWIQQHWDDPDALYTTICMSLNDGFFVEVLGASERLLAIDPNQERSHTVRGIVLMKTGDLDGAERILQDCIQRCGRTGTLLTNLAKVYAERGDHKQSEATLWEGLTLDPNQDNGLLWWGAIHEERDATNGFPEAMQRVAAIEGSWRPQLWLAQACLEKKNLTEAKRYYDHILQVAADQSDAMIMISGDLGKNGYVCEVLDTILPIYNPEKHDIRIGGNLLQAYLETKNYVDGEKLLHRLFALNRPDIKEQLTFYATEFDKLK